MVANGKTTSTGKQQIILFGVISVVSQIKEN